MAGGVTALRDCEKFLVGKLKAESKRMHGSGRGSMRLYQDWVKGYSSHPMFQEYVEIVRPIGAALMEIRSGMGMVVMGLSRGQKSRKVAKVKRGR